MEKKEVLLVAGCCFDSSTSYGYCLMDREILIDVFQLDM